MRAILLTRPGPCALAGVVAAVILAISCTTTPAEPPPREPALSAEEARARALAEARRLEERAPAAPLELEPPEVPVEPPAPPEMPINNDLPEMPVEPPAPPEVPVEPPAPPEMPTNNDLPEMPPLPPDVDDEERERLLEEYLRSFLEAERLAEIADVHARIIYPDELFGAPMIRADWLDPGMVLFYYPMRATGGVSADLDLRNYRLSSGSPDTASVDRLIEQLNQYLGDGETVAHYRNLNMLQITAREDSVPFILDVLHFLDSPRQQVILEAAVWEITEATDRQLAANVSVAAREGSRTFFQLFDNRFDAHSFLDSLVGGQPFQGSILEFVSSAESNRASMTAVFQFVESLGYADLVAQPRMRVSAGEVARITTGDRIPVYELYRVTAPGRPEHRTNYHTVGVELHIMPMRVGQDTIEIALVPSVTEITGYLDVGISGIANPVISERSAATQVVVANRELITIGGLDQTRKIVSETKIPILGDIPVLKYLFSSQRETTKKVQVWFTVRPTIAGEAERIILPELIGMQ